MTQTDNELRAMAWQWLANEDYNWDIACTLHVPNLMRSFERGWDAGWLQRQLGYYFNRLDRRLFKAKVRDENRRLPRVVTFENGDKVGWHIHVFTKAPPNLSHDDLMALMEKLWLDQVGKYASPNFSKRLFWAERKHGHYEEYALKLNNEQRDHFYSQVEVYIDKLDMHNTYIPNLLRS